MLSQSAAKTTSLYIMFGILMVTFVIGLCAVLAADARLRWSPWGPCSVTCGHTPGVQSREWRWRCRTGLNGWCRTANKETRGCSSNTPCVTPKPAACRCTPPRYTEPCCPRGETSSNIARRTHILRFLFNTDLSINEFVIRKIIPESRYSCVIRHELVTHTRRITESV